jgi:hypothetical protein
MLSNAKIRASFDGGKTSKEITAEEAYNTYIKQQREGGPAKLQLLTFNPIYKRFLYQHPTGFSVESGRDLVILSVNVEHLKRRRKELDIPLFSASRILVNLGNLPSLLVVQALKNFQMKQCHLGLMSKDWSTVEYTPILKAENSRLHEYKYPMNDLDLKSYKVYRITHKDGAATASEFGLIS